LSSYTFFKSKHKRVQSYSIIKTIKSCTRYVDIATVRRVDLVTLTSDLYIDLNIDDYSCHVTAAHQISTFCGNAGMGQTDG